MADFPASFDAPFDPLAYAVDDASTSAAASVGLLLDWRAYGAYGAGDAYAAVPRAGGGFGKAAALCIGSRQCQKARGESEADTGVMCPSFRVTRDDLHSTRGRAAMLRAALDGDLGLDAVGADEMAAAMDLCVSCKGCKRECPNGVDMASLRAETLAQRWRRQAVPRRTRWFASLPRWLPRLRRWRPLLRLVRRLHGGVPPLARWVERRTGLSAHRQLPLPAARPAHERLTESPSSEAGDVEHVGELALLVDCFANHLEPEVAEDAVRVLQAAGWQVHPVMATPDRPLCCGRTAYSAGLIDEAREHARALLEALAPHLVAGRPIVGLEPSCLSMLRDEYAMFGLPTEAVAALGRQAKMFEECLARQLGRPGTPRRASPWQALPSTVLVHGHCHQKAHGTLKSMRKLLGSVPQLEAQWIESSCCGMAGSFGYEAEHHAASAAMAELALLPALRRAPADALVLASGTSCRQQIRDGSGRAPLHLAQLLARALPAAATPAGVPHPALITEDGSA